MLLTVLAVAAISTNCGNLPNQGAMNRCADAAFQRADAEMTLQWRRTFAYMKSRDAKDTSRGGGFGHAAALVASQRAWLRFRDAHCVVSGGQFAGGSLQALTNAQCKRQLTDARTPQLREMVWTKI